MAMSGRARWGEGEIDAIYRPKKARGHGEEDQKHPKNTAIGEKESRTTTKTPSSQSLSPPCRCCTVSPLSLSVSTLTPRSELTLRISRPSSASSRLISSSFPCSGPSGLSPSETGRLAKSGFLNIFLNASAIIAASCPLNGPSLFAALPVREIVDAPSLTTLGASRGAP